MRWITTILLFTLWIAPAPAAIREETAEFSAATRLFNDRLYPEAEKRFVEFQKKYPESEHRSKAVLYQARSLFSQDQHNRAIELLNQKMAEAGPLADEYQYWLAESLFGSAQHAAAAQAYAQLIEKFPESSRRLEASYSQALAWSRLDDWPRVTRLLHEPESVFQQAAQAAPTNQFVSRGWLLLAEAFFHQKQYPQVEETLHRLSAQSPEPEFAWRLNYLRWRTEMAGKRFDDAQKTIDLLQAAAEAANRPQWQAETQRLRAETLEKLGQLDEAIQAHEKNLENAELRRAALLKIIEITLAQNKHRDAMTRLQNFIERFPNDTALDVARLSLGELRLKEAVTLPDNGGGGTPAQTRSNLLQQAMQSFDRVIADFPESPVAGRSHLNRGWCLWLDRRFAEARPAFEEAVARLPVSDDQAIARFKLADTHFHLEEYAPAASHYDRLITDHARSPRIRQTLFDRALYQMLRANLRLRNHEAARKAALQLLADFPESDYADRSLLLLGQNLSRDGNPAQARDVFNLVKAFPDSALLPEIELAIARTFVREGRWEDAVEAYDQWVTNFSGHSLLPQGEFSRALTHAQAGDETNAFQLFTNFVARFPGNTLMPQAQNWIADFYFNREEFTLAEASYQELAQNTNTPPNLAYQARLKAGYSAFENQLLEDAFKYFGSLCESFDKDTNAPPAVVKEAWVALGDTLFAQFLQHADRPTNTFLYAINAFNRVAGEFPPAWKRIGDCQLQWAIQKSDPKAFERATEAYNKVLESTAADVSTRNQARIGLGLVLEKRNQPRLALEQYTQLVYAREPASVDPVWAREAGLHAARLCESLEQWEQAINVYERLAKLVPGLQPALEKRIAAIRPNVQAAKN